MVLNLLRYLLIAAVLLTSNSQALMAVQSYLQQTQHQTQHQTQQQAAAEMASVSPCHQAADTQPDHPVVTLECEKDCQCCAGSCSSFAITLDFPVAVPDSQLVEPTLSVHFPLQTRSELLQRPPIFA